MKRGMWAVFMGCSVLGAACNDLGDDRSITGPEIGSVAPRHALTGGQWSVETIEVGAAFACALESDGEAYCWGDNEFGQLGDGTVSDRTVPTLVSGGRAFTQIDVGDLHACALTAAGEAYCWGSNANGRIGDGTTTGRREPARVAGGHTFTAISAGSSHTCALDEEGAAWCWGRNNPDGVLGTGSTNPTIAVPEQVVGGHSFASIEAIGRTCALEADGTAYCWGDNLDRDVIVTAPTPVPGGAPRFSTLMATNTRACGVGTDGLAYCWGDNHFDSDDVPLRTEPTLVDPDHLFTSVSDRGSPCGLDTVGDLYCWKWATFELVSASSGNQIVGFSGAAAVSTASGDVVAQNLCALDAGGFAYCWGSNESGQLGDGTRTNRSQPTPVMTPGSSPGEPRGVTDLTVVESTPTTLTLRWTQVDDGTGNPARYRVRYAEELPVWKNGSIGCASTIRGDEIGAPISCTVENLQPDTRYELQLMSFRVVDGAWRDAKFSNLAVGRTTAEPAAPKFAVDDLRVVSRTSTVTTVRWTEVDDGTGNPASYRVKHSSDIDGHYKDATIAGGIGGGCQRTISGTEVGAVMECFFSSGGSTLYEDDESFEVQLMSFRIDEDGVWRNARYSNVAVAAPID